MRKKISKVSGNPVLGRVNSLNGGIVWPKNEQASLGRDACFYGQNVVKLSPGRCRLAAHRSDRLVFAVRLLLLSGLADIDSALEERSVFNGDAGRNYVAGERTVAANIHAIACGQVAADFAEHHNLASIDVGCNYAIASNRNPISGKVDRAFYPSIDVQRLGSGDFTFDHQGLPDGSLICCAGRNRSRSTAGGCFRYCWSARR